MRTCIVRRPVQIKTKGLQQYNLGNENKLRFTLFKDDCIILRYLLWQKQKKFPYNAKLFARLLVTAGAKLKIAFINYFRFN